MSDDNGSYSDIRIRRRTKGWWIRNNIVLREGEPGIEIESGKMRVGDGKTPWLTLPELAGGGNDSAGIPLTQKAAANGVATLDANGLIPGSQLPPLAIGEPHIVVSQAAMLALTAQRGDVAIRTDLSPNESFVLATDDPTQLTNWKQITADSATLGLAHSYTDTAVSAAQTTSDSRYVRTNPLDIDALAKRFTADLQIGAAWALKNSVAIIIEETGWPSASDTVLWNALFDRYLRQLTARGIPSMMWGAGRRWGTYPLGAYTAATPNTDIDTVKSNGLLMEQHLDGPPLFRGLCISGGESGADTNVDGVADTLAGGQKFSNLFTGVTPTDYSYPSANDLVFLARRGYRVARLMFRWERLQPTLGAALNTTEVGRITTLLDNAAAAGIQIVPGMWNQGGYFVGASSSVSTNTKIVLDPAGTVTMANFADFWSKFAAAFGAHPALYGYSLMNEPNTNAEAHTTGPNLITNPGAESDTTGWVAKNGTLTRDTTVKRNGAASFKVVANGSGITGIVASNGIPVTPGSSYYASAWLEPSTTARQINVQVDWSDSSFAYMSSSYGSFPAEATGSFAQVTGTFTVPAGAAYAGLNVITYGATSPNGEAHYIEDVAFYATTSAYSAPQVWEQIAQAAVTAIRAIDMIHEIWVATYGGQSPKQVATDHPTPFITDPAGLSRYALHHYGNVQGGSGGEYALSYANELAAAVTAGF